MFTIRSIASLSREDLERIVPGYVSEEGFSVSEETIGSATVFSLRPVAFSPAFVKRHDYSGSGVLTSYLEIIRQGSSWGAFVGEKLVGLLLGQVELWNSTFAVREFGVDPGFRKQGIGTALMNVALADARCGKTLRGVVCETQSTNIGAIRFYQKIGFTIQGLDTGLYTNGGLETGEVAMFLRKPLDQSA